MAPFPRWLSLERDIGTAASDRHLFAVVATAHLVAVALGIVSFTRDPTSWVKTAGARFRCATHCTAD